MTRSLFDGIAADYDRMNTLLSLGTDRRWRRAAAAAAKGSPSRLLDLACGTGEFSFELARRFPGAEVLGVDFAPAMLEAARRKNDSPRVRFEEGNALDMSALRDGSFDLCSCAFGFRNFPDRRKALFEVRRVLAAGGELLVLEFFRPANAALGSLVSAWIRMATAVFARGRSAAYRHLVESIWRMDTAEGFADMARGLGFRLCSSRCFFPSCTFMHFVAGARSGGQAGGSQST